MGFLQRLRLLFKEPEPVILNPCISSAIQVNRAIDLDRAGKQDEAASIYWRLIEANPDEAGAMINFGDLLLRMNRTQEAAAVLGVAVIKAPRSSAAWCNFSAALSAVGDHEQALIAANKAVNLEDNNAMAYYNRAECWCAMNQTRLSIRDFETAAELDPNNAEISEKLMLARIAIQERPVQPFGDVKHEPHGHGAWIVDGIEVAATLQCPHCGGHFVSMRGSSAERLFCLAHMALTCGALACNTCRSWQLDFDEAERRAVGLQ